MNSSNKVAKIAPGAIVCAGSNLEGDVTVGEKTLVYTRASVIAEAGPVVIGDSNIIQEKALIHYKFEEEISDGTTISLNIGVNNVFEVGCIIRAKAIGDHNIFEPYCYIGPNVEIGNDCIIGTGCHITMEGRLPDHTVIVGHLCISLLTINVTRSSIELERQHDEILVLSEIYNPEFSYKSVKGGFLINFEVEITSYSSFLISIDSGNSELPISHLPPIRLQAFLSQGYPSHCHPDFTVSCSWLSTEKLDLIVAELFKLWEKHKSEILFIWYLFLRDESLELIGLQHRYNLNEINERNQEQTLPVKCNESKSEASSSKLENRSDHLTFDPSIKKETENRKVCNIYLNHNDNLTCLRNNPIVELDKENKSLLTTHQKQEVETLYFNLIDYDTLKSTEIFKKSRQECNICFCMVLGKKCIQLPCSHISCAECLKGMCEFHINYGSVNFILCAEENCDLEIPVNFIRDLISKELFEKYNEFMLYKLLDSTGNTIYCPRPHCQHPAEKEGEKSLAICPSCYYSFCVYCRRTYHGVEMCRLKSDEERELFLLYQNSDCKKQLELEKKYGRRRLMESLTAAKTEAWMTENSKPCPCCHIKIEKTDGCNHMVCERCNTNFCWLCLTRLSSLNPFLHFQDPKSKCFDLLFLGLMQENEEGDVV